MPPEGSTNPKGVNDLIDFDGGFISFSFPLGEPATGDGRGRSFLKIDNFKKSGCDRRDAQGEMEGMTYPKMNLITLQRSK